MGRKRELRVLARLLDELTTESTGVALQVVGEPGIGKTCVLRELRWQAGARGHQVFAGRAAEFEAELPFGVFSDALDDWLMQLGRDRLQRLACGLADELAVVLQAFEGLRSRGRPEIDQERYRAYRAVRGLLGVIAADAPVVLVLDDVQWADPGSIELIGHLVTHPPRGPVLLALGFRPSQVSAQLSAALAGAVRDRQAWRMELEPLSAPEARELLEGVAPLAAPDRWYRESGGNPFFLLQLARGAELAAARRGSAVSTAGSSAVPEPVRAALASELSSLSAPARVLLQGAAVTGDPFAMSMANVAAGLRSGEALDLTDELVRFGLVRPTAAAERYAFRHPIVRASVYELAARSWCAAAHGRIAELLAARGDPPVAQAPHVERSAAPGDMRAVAVLSAAAATIAPRAPALAARWYAAALRLLPDTPAALGHRIELLIAMATAHGASGQLEDSRSALCEVLERLPEGDSNRVTVIAYCAGVEHLLGRHREADARLGHAHRAQATADSVDAVLLKIEIAAGHAFQNRHADMLDWARRARTGAVSLGLAAAEVAAAGQTAMAHYFLGLPADEVTDRAAAGFDALDDEQLASRLDLGLWVGWTEAVLERHERALEHCDRVIDVSRASGQGAALLVTMTAKAWALTRMGRLDDADETLTAAIEAGSLAPNLFLSVAVGLSAVVATYRGDYEAALRAGERCVSLARTADPGLIPGMSGLYHAIPLIELADAQRAHDILLEMSGGPDLQTSRSGHAPAYELLTRAELALGRVDAAEAWARKAIAATHGGQLAAEATFAQRATAAVELARGDGAAAAHIALAAAERADRNAIPIEAARCRILAAKALARDRKLRAATGELERASDELRRSGAHGFRTQADDELQRLRHGDAEPTLAGMDGLASLTERERQIAELVRDGHTNRQIGATIHVSEKSVERSMSRIFTKLAVSSRTAVALRVAAEEDPGARPGGLAPDRGVRDSAD